MKTKKILQIFGFLILFIFNWGISIPSLKAQLSFIESPSGHNADNRGYRDSPIVYNSALYMRYLGDDGNYDLGKYDGTTLSIIPSPSGYDNPTRGHNKKPIVYDGNLYMIYTDNSDNDDLMKYDGTSLIPIPSPSGYDDPSNGYRGAPIVFNSKLYLRYRTNAGENIMLNYDGTTLTPIPNPVGYTYSGGGIIYDNALYLKYYHPATTASHLFRYNGTTFTHIPNPSGYTTTGYFGSPIVFNGKLHVQYSANAGNTVLMECNITTLTPIFPSVQSNYSNSSRGCKSERMIYNSNLYLEYRNNAGTYELYKYDGTILTLIPNPSGYENSSRGYNGEMFVYGGKLQVSYRHNTSYYTLFNYDGTILTEVPNPAGYTSSGTGYNSNLNQNQHGIEYNGVAYMHYTNSAFGGVLFSYDGTTLTEISNPVNYTNEGIDNTNPFLIFDNKLCISYEHNDGSYDLGIFTSTSLAIVTTTAQSNITATTADLGGNVTNNGGAIVTERGIVWDTSTSPAVSDNKVQIGSGNGVFNQTVTGLPSNTTVFVRSYAINSVGTSYGNEISFATLSPSSTSEINLVGNGIDIPSGTTATSTGNNTDLEQTVGIPISKTFTIQNTGTSALTISSITSSNAAFVVSNAPSNIIISGQATFTVTFTTPVSGAQTSTITINNNDADEPAYTFVVVGEGICPITTNITASTSTILSNQVGSIGVESQLGVNYQLQDVSNGNANVGNSVAGTGGTIYLQTDLLTSSTDFRVEAIRGLDCANQILNTVTITVSTTVSGYGYEQTQINACVSGSTLADIDVSLSGSTYLWSNTATSQDLTNVVDGIYSLSIDGTTTLPVIVGSPVQWESLIRATPTNDGRVKTDAVYAWNLSAAAISSSKLQGGETGGFTFVVEDMSTISDMMIGFAKPNNLIDFRSIKNSFYITPAGGIYVYWNNAANFILTTATVVVGDRITMTREGQNIKYYHNATLLYTDTQLSNTDDLVVDMSIIKDTSPQIWFSKCSTPFEVTYQQTAFDDCVTPAGEGSITLSPQGGAAPYAYLWSNGAAAVQSPTNMETGITFAQVSSVGSAVSAPIIIGNPVQWASLVNVSETQNTLVATSPNNGYNAGAISALGSPNNLDAGVTYIYNSSQTEYMVGLSGYNTDPDWTSLEYSIIVNQNDIRIYESGVFITSYEGIKDGDRITIMRQGTNILYFRNSTEIHRSLTTIPKVLHVDICVWAGVSPVVYSSFCTDTPSSLKLYYSLPSIDDCTTGAAEGSVLLEATGGNAAYSYLWTGGSTSNSRTGLSRGLYEATLTSGTGTVTSPIVVGGFVNWANLTANTTQIAGKLSASSGATFDWTTPAGGLSSNRLAASTDGGISYVIPSLTGVGNYMVGLSPTSSVTSSWEGQGYCAWVGYQNRVFIYESGTLVHTAGSVSIGDRISILRKAGNIEFYINTTLVHTFNGVTIELAADISVIEGTSPTVYASFCNTGFRIANKAKANETNTETVVEEDRFSIYPNPSTGIFNVRFATQLSENTQVTIFDGIGRKVSTQTFEKGSQEFTVELKNQPKGMYLIHFNQNGATYSKQLIIE